MALDIADTYEQAPQGRVDLVRVFEHEPDLLQGLDKQVADVLRDRAIVPRLWLDRGEWEPPVVEAEDGGWLGMLVLDGLLTRSVAVGERVFPELVGAGDVLRPWDEHGESGVLAHTTSWDVLLPTTVAVLDRRFSALAGRCPDVIGALLARTLERTRALACTMAMSHDRYAGRRLRMLFWRLADRWGRVTPEGVLVPLPLTHEILARLTGLRRPTASTTLAQLAEEGEIVRRRNGWLLTGEPPAIDEAA